MIFDVHAHIIGIEPNRNGNYLCPTGRMSLPLRLMLQSMRKTLGGGPEDSLDAALKKQVWQWASESRADRIVLLAMDGAYQEDGQSDLERTRVMTSNDFVADFIAGHPKLLFGASVHPYRKDALDELDRVALRGASLIKWLPSAQNIAPDDPRCIPFYERLAELQIPLLTHTGVEHTLAAFDDRLNDPSRLAPALRRGVTVIAAHCGTRMFLHERSRFGEWMRLAREFPNCYGDLSAFALPLHGAALRRILNDPVLSTKVVYGSDFPTPPMPLWYLPRLGWRRTMALRAVQNPFDRTLLMTKGMGVPDPVFARAGGLLKTQDAARLSLKGNL